MSDRKQQNQHIVDFVRSIYGDGFVPLHRPVFEGNERRYLVECIDSNFVSSVGPEIEQFERSVAEFTGAAFAVATVNGTAALHIALELAGAQRDDEVITQALTFIATCNAIHYTGATPVFTDVDRDTLGMSPTALRDFLSEYVEVRDGIPVNKATGRKIAACVPMHTFGIPCRVDEIVSVCHDYGIPVIEDAAESLGSYLGDRHTGTFGDFATLSFNGNKVITTGGGGMILTDDEAIARRAKHITTTAKQSHAWEFMHDEVGYNYRMPNLNAVLGCAQMENLEEILAIKAEVSGAYSHFFGDMDIEFVKCPEGRKCNNWINAVILGSRDERDEFLAYSNEQGVMTRPIWQLMSEQVMFQGCQNDGLETSRWLEQRVVNIPSSVPDRELHRLRVKD